MKASFNYKRNNNKTKQKETIINNLKSFYSRIESLFIIKIFNSLILYLFQIHEI